MSVAVLSAAIASANTKGRTVNTNAATAEVGRPATYPPPLPTTHGPGMSREYVTEQCAVCRKVTIDLQAHKDLERHWYSSQDYSRSVMRRWRSAAGGDQR